MEKQKDWAVWLECVIPEKSTHHQYGRKWWTMMHSRNYLEYRIWAEPTGCSMAPRAPLGFTEFLLSGSCFVINRSYYSFSPHFQTQLIKSSTKMLTLFPGERKAKISFPQRTPPVGVRQTSIVSFFTLQPGMVTCLGTPREQKGVRSFFHAGTFRSGDTSALC